MAIKTIHIDGETFRYNKLSELVSMVGTHINGVRSELQNEIWKREREITRLRDQLANRHEMRINQMMQSQEEMGRALARLSDNTSHAMRMYLEETKNGKLSSRAETPYDIAMRAQRQQEKTAMLVQNYGVGPEQFLKGAKNK